MVGQSGPDDVSEGLIKEMRMNVEEGLTRDIFSQLYKLRYLV